MSILFRFFTSSGTETYQTAQSVEAAILAYRKARRSRKGAQGGTYRHEGNWYKF